MPLTNTKTRLSRQYVYVRFTDLTFSLSETDVHKVAFMDNAAAEPTEEDWRDAIVVTSTNGEAGAPHALYRANVGDSLAVLIGPARGDAVTTLDLAADEYLVWSDTRVPDSDERYAVWHGPLKVITA